MRQIREILRQKWVLGRSHREVARSLGPGVGTVSTTLRRAREAGLDWAAVETLPDLEQHPEGYRYTQFCEYYRRSWGRRASRTRRRRGASGGRTSLPITARVSAVGNSGAFDRVRQNQLLR